MRGTDAIWTWLEGRWRQGDVPIPGAADHATWFGSPAFNRARSCEGTRPISTSTARANESPRRTGLTPPRALACEPTPHHEA